MIVESNVRRAQDRAFKPRQRTVSEWAVALAVDRADNFIFRLLSSTTSDLHRSYYQLMTLLLLRPTQRARSMEARRFQ